MCAFTVRNRVDKRVYTILFGPAVKFTVEVSFSFKMIMCFQGTPMYRLSTCIQLVYYCEYDYGYINIIHIIYTDNCIIIRVCHGVTLEYYKNGYMFTWLSFFMPTHVTC